MRGGTIFTATFDVCRNSFFRPAWKSFTRMNVCGCIFQICLLKCQIIPHSVLLIILAVWDRAEMGFVTAANLPPLLFLRKFLLFTYTCMVISFQKL
jgi:hypothetical protein